MARKEQVTCDVCGNYKQSTNHWFSLIYFNEKDWKISITSSRDSKSDSPYIDLCGEACVLKKVAELISK